MTSHMSPMVFGLVLVTTIIVIQSAPVEPINESKIFL